jgi:hypothetical protein
LARVRRGRLRRKGTVSLAPVAPTARPRAARGIAPGMGVGMRKSPERAGQDRGCWGGVDGFWWGGRPPFQGSGWCVWRRPRASPWAALVCPVGAWCRCGASSWSGWWPQPRCGWVRVGRGPRVGLVPRPTRGLGDATPLALAGQEPDDAKPPPSTPASAVEASPTGILAGGLGWGGSGVPWQSWGGRPGEGSNSAASSDGNTVLLGLLEILAEVFL